jgi:hypothetical protein
MTGQEANLAYNPNTASMAQKALSALKIQQNIAVKEAESPEKPEVTQQAARSDSAVRWTLVSKDGKSALEALPNTTQVDFTTVSIHEESVEAPRFLSFLGYKIDLEAKIDGYKDSYLKNYSLSKSHNLIVAKFAEAKVAFLGMLLSMLGVDSEDIRKLQKKAITNSINENKVLFEENEYNEELIAILGGSGKKTKGQLKIVGEIRKQLITHAKRLGLSDYYSQQRMLEIKVAQCQKILLKFEEEKSNLKYQLAYFGAG